MNGVRLPHHTAPHDTPRGDPLSVVRFAIPSQPLQSLVTPVPGSWPGGRKKARPTPLGFVARGRTVCRPGNPITFRGGVCHDRATGSLAGTLVRETAPTARPRQRHRCVHL